MVKRGSTAGRCCERRSGERLQVAGCDARQLDRREARWAQPATMATGGGAVSRGGNRLRLRGSAGRRSAGLSKRGRSLRLRRCLWTGGSTNAGSWPMLATHGRQTHCPTACTAEQSPCAATSVSIRLVSPSCSPHSPASAAVRIRSKRYAPRAGCSSTPVLVPWCLLRRPQRCHATR